MAGGVGIQVAGDTKVALRFDQFPKFAHDKILARMTPIIEGLELRIKAAAPHRTGDLQKSLRHAVYDDVPKKIVGRVSVVSDFAKVGALEYGASKNIKIKGHSAKLDHAWNRRLNAPITVFREAHRRQENLIARRFMRGPLHAFAPAAIAALKDAVNEAIEEGPT